MATMNISLPDPMKAWIEGHHDDVDGYFLDLVQQDQERKRKLEALRAFVDECEASGISDRSVEDIIADGEKMAIERGDPE